MFACDSAVWNLSEFRIIVNVRVALTYLVVNEWLKRR